MKIVSLVIIPFFILFIMVFGTFKKVSVYNLFLDGVKDGLKIIVDILPATMAMVFAVNLFFDSNVLSFFLFPIHKIIHLPSELLSMMFLRPISGNATILIMTNIFKKFGVDSVYGFLASLIQGCTDTTFYVVALYYGSVRVLKSRYTLLVALIADFVGIMTAIILTNIFY